MKRISKVLLLSIFVLALTICLASCDKIFDIIDMFGDGDSDYDDGYHKNCYEGGEHDWQLVESREPTCFESGYEYYACKYCGAYDEQYLQQLEHDPAIEEGYPSTCCSYGRTDRTYCTRCDQTLEGGETIGYSSEHSLVILEAVPPTCTENGLSEGEQCSVCGHITIYQETLWASHNYVTIPAVPATCTTDGLTEGEACDICGEVSVTQIKIPGGHNYVDVSGYEATCTADGLTSGKQCNICNEWVIEQTVIPAGHSPETVPGFPATCLSDGLTDGSNCTSCGETITPQTVIEKLMHTPTAVNGFAATCKTNGLSDGSKCSVCGTALITQHTIYANGHKFGDNGECTGCDLVATAELKYSPVNPSSFFALLSTDSETVAWTVGGLAIGSEATVIVIPDTYEGLPVVGIDAGAFEGNTNITSVIIPESIVNVGANAFNGCTSLVSIECADFAQSDSWDNNWYGNSTQINMSAPLNEGKTPYDIYLEAMMSTNHGIDRFKMTTHQYSYEIADGFESLDTHTTLIQYQCMRDCYVYNKVQDYANNTAQESEIYYVDGYIYQKGNYSDGHNTYSYAKIPYSYECWLGEMTLNRTDLPEFTEEYFKSVELVKALDGTMHLKIEMDGELMLQAIAGILKDQFDDMPVEILAIMEFTNLVYEYKFDSNGNLSEYSSDSTLMIRQGIPDEYGTLHYMGMRTKSVSTLSEVGTYNGVSAPTYYLDATKQYEGFCSGGNHTNIVEVEGIAPTCYADGVTDFSYCKWCFRAVEPLEIIPAEHNYEYNECTECGHFQWGSTDMEYELNEDETGYILVGIGNCKDTDIVVPHQIYGLPVLTIDADAFDGTDVELIFVNGHCYTASTFEGIEDTTDLWN